MGATNQTQRIEISSYRWSKEGDDIAVRFWFEVICHANRLKSQRSVKRGQFPLFLIHNQSRFFTKKNRLSKRIEPFFYVVNVGFIAMLPPSYSVSDFTLWQNIQSTYF